MALYSASPGQGLERVTLFELPFAGYMHSFAMTEQQLVFYLAPHVYGADSGASYVEAHDWQPERDGRLLVVDKADFERRRWIEAPAGFAFHLADARSRPGGEIVLRAAWSPEPALMDEAMFEVMCGASPQLGNAPELVEIALSARGQVRLERTGHHGEFPVVDPRRPSAFVVLAWDRELTVLDPRGRPRRLRVPGNVRLEEHRFAPRGERPGDGWLVGTGYDLDARESVLTVFDLQSRSEAPVAVARMDRHVPFGFHGWFVRAE